MADTIQLAAQRAQDILPDLPDTKAADYANLVLADLHAWLPEIQRIPNATPVSVTFGNGVGEVAMPETITQVEEVWFANTRLEATNVETLDEQNIGWRTVAAAVPQQFYITTDATGARILGLYPIPQVGGNASVYGSEKSSTVYDNTNWGTNHVPAILSSSKVFTDGIVYYGSKILRPNESPARLQIYRDSIQAEIHYIRTMNQANPDPTAQNIRGM